MDIRVGASTDLFPAPELRVVCHCPGRLECSAGSFGRDQYIVRSLGLQERFYNPLLDFFHSPALKLDRLTVLWSRLVLKIHPGVIREKSRLLLAVDGITVGKEGKKMRGVKLLHQQSEGNTKAEYIGHSCQAAALLCQALESVFAVPLASRIHEGVVFSNRDARTLLDKMVLLLNSLGLTEPFYCGSSQV